MTDFDATTRPADLDGLPLANVEQLRARVRHITRHQARNLEALANERGLAAAMRRARILEGLAALELAVAEYQAHPEFRA
jgi:hypothetical protein